MKTKLILKYIKLLHKVEYLTIDIAGFFNRLQRIVKGYRWKIESDLAKDSQRLSLENRK
jgi:hypothetical protein